MKSPHTFHIPVMGLGFTIDTPLKVAKFGINSVVSIMEDELIEKMRKVHADKNQLDYVEIKSTNPDARAERISSYLNLLEDLIEKQIKALKNSPFNTNSDADKYFTLLPSKHPFHILYLKYINETDKRKKFELELVLKKLIVPGSVDVNIMCKADRDNYDKDSNPLPSYYSNASSSLRGYVKSKCKGDLVLSAGFNPRLYNYISEWDEFKPGINGIPLKRIILKVSDFRSAQIQGKYLAKKGILISEFRIESGLNCGGHAFPTDGQLFGSVLEEFKTKLSILEKELLEICNKSLASENKNLYQTYDAKISAQGGVGTSAEHLQLLEDYKLDSVGWGSPFLLVAEATNLDNETVNQLAEAKKEDYFLSNNSPLGVMINNFKPSSAIKQIKERIALNKPGSPCIKKYLAFNIEFTKEPICVASRQYQDLKIKQINETINDSVKRSVLMESIVEKECLCEGLGISALKINNAQNPKRPQGVSICPGPNLSYFSGTFSLAQMINHIYGKEFILNTTSRPHMFLNELSIYLDYARTEINKLRNDFNISKKKTINSLLTNIKESINYYKSKFDFQLREYEQKLNELSSLLSVEPQLI